jgi:hypothetical protein
MPHKGNLEATILALDAITLSPTANVEISQMFFFSCVYKVNTMET